MFQKEKGKENAFQQKKKKMIERTRADTLHDDGRKNKTNRIKTERETSDKNKILNMRLELMTFSLLD